MSVLIDLQLFGCVDYFKILTLETHLVIPRYERFKKRSFHNRYIIAGANGLINLTIPLAGGREQKAEITDVEIADSTNWRTRHWRSIKSAYRNAPFFEYYGEVIERLLFNEEKRLFDLNFSILTGLCNLLNINPCIDFTDSFSSDSEMHDYRNSFLPGSFQDMKENWTPRYQQVFEERLGFQPNLSILDLLFCEGPNSLRLLQERY